MLTWLKKQTTSTPTIGLHLMQHGFAIAYAATKPDRYVTDYIPCERAQQPAMLQQSLQQHQLQQARVNLIIPGDDYELYLTTTAPMEHKTLQAALRWRLEEITGNTIDDPVIDVFNLPASGQRGQDQHVQVVVSRQSAIQVYIDWLKDAGVTVNSIEIVELSLTRLMSLTEANEQGVMLLTGHDQLGLLLAIKQNELYLTRRLTAQAMDNGGDDLLLEVQRSLDFYQSRFRERPPGTVILHPADGYGTTTMQQLQTLGNTSSTNWNDTLLPFVLDKRSPDSPQTLAALGAALRMKNVQSSAA